MAAKKQTVKKIDGWYRSDDASARWCNVGLFCVVLVRKHEEHKAHVSIEDADAGVFEMEELEGNPSFDSMRHTANNLLEKLRKSLDVTLPDVTVRADG